MQEVIKAVSRTPSGQKGKWDALFTRREAEKARRFHQSIPGYGPTPLVSLPQMPSRASAAATVWPIIWPAGWGSPWRN